MLHLHLDTDLGGDIDDLCALAMLLRWPDVELTGITTSAEEGGRRAGYAEHVLRLAGRADIPLAAGADAATSGYRDVPTYPPDDVYWPEPIARRPAPVTEALALLKRSIESGAVVVATGPFTNLCLLDQAYPGILRDAHLVLMGGSVFPPRPGLPAWDHTYDYNIQQDVDAAWHVLASGQPLLVPLAISLETALRQADLPRLRQGDAVAQLIARQAEAFTDLSSLAQTAPALPADFINFQHDPLACAVAAGWDGVTVEERPLALDLYHGWLVEREDPSGWPLRVVTTVEAERFNRHWLDLVAPTV